MKIRISTRRIFAGLTVICGLGNAGWAQDSGQAPSLGDLARKTRQEHTATDHVASKQILNEESQAAATWPVVACKHRPCYSLSITLPKNAQWSKADAGQKYAFIALPGHEAEPGHIIRVYGADLLNSSTVEQGKHAFLQGWFSQPYVFGAAAKFVFDDQTTVDGNPAVITHFTLPNKMGQYRGLGLIAGTPAGSFGFACVFRDDDSGDATSVCESVLSSARITVMEETRPKGKAADDDDEDCGCADDDAPK
jgi:hypothetical protein